MQEPSATASAESREGEYDPSGESMPIAHNALHREAPKCQEMSSPPLQLSPIWAERTGRKRVTEGKYQEIL